MLITSWLRSFHRRPRQSRKKNARQTRSRRTPTATLVEYLEDRTLLTSLNAVIDAVLDANDDAGGIFDPAGGFTTQDFVFTTADSNVPDEIQVGHDSSTGDTDLQLSDVTLTFNAGLHFSGGVWMGQVGVEATNGVLYPGLLDILIEDDGTDTSAGNDADEFAVVGAIDLEAGTPASFKLDELDAADIGMPEFIQVTIDELDMQFPDFRGDDTNNTLVLDASYDGIDTGDESLNNQLATDLEVTGGVLGLELDMDVIRTGVRDVLSGDIHFPTSPITDLNGIIGNIEGELFGVEVDGSFIVNEVTADPDGAGPLPESSALYAAVEGDVQFEDFGFGFAFAFSELGPLQVFGHADTNIVIEPTSGLAINNLRLGARFSTTIEDLQTETDFSATGGSFDSVNSRVTLTIPNNDLAAGNIFRVRGAGNSAFDGEFEVFEVNGNAVTFEVDADPGVFVGSAEVVRVTLTDPLDLRDSGLSSGIGAPESVEDWKLQLDQAVVSQIEAGGDVWGRLFDEFVLGGGATLSFDPRIPQEILQFDVDFMLGTVLGDADEDTSLQVWLKGEMSLYDGQLTIPASMFADLGEDDGGFDGSFLFLADVVPDDPLLVFRGEATFETLADDGFRIALEGAVDLNIPEVTTLTLAGSTSIEFAEADSVLEMTLEFDADLSEKNFGEIASSNGVFHAIVDMSTGGTDVWGAAILGTDLSFTQQFGLFANASGLLRINSTDEVQPDEVLEDVHGNDVFVALPAESFALRLNGEVDFRIDHNNNGTFTPGESAFQVVGTFVLEFSSNGFNVALFKEGANQTAAPASLKLGPKGSTLLEFGVLGFLAIRDNGFAADLVLSAEANLPLGLASISGAAVLVVNTTREEIVFEIPGAGVDPNRPNGLTMRIPKAAPANPSSILTAPGPGNPASGLQNLINGSPTWTEGAAGAYGVVFVDAEVELLEVLEFDVSGYVLLSEDVVSLQVNLYAGADFLGLASGSVSGSMFFSSEGEFEAHIDARAQLGPNWININGGADLSISYLDNNGTASGGSGAKVLDVAGNLNVGLTVDISPFPSIDVNLNALSVGYNSATGSITVGVSYPEPFWDRYCVDLGWFGTACFPYPNVRTRTYSFSVGTLTVNEPPPPPVLAVVNSNGVLTVNAGNSAVRAARRLRSDEINEAVTIDAIGPMVNGRQTITVTMFDVTQTFENVTSLSIPDMHDGNDVVEILSAVSVPGNINLGNGDDRLLNNGGSALTVNGGAGDDRLKGSGAREHFLGGSGSDVIEGGGGNDTISGGAGEDTFTVAVRGSESKNVNIGISNAGFTASIGSDQLSPITDVENLNIENGRNRAEGDTFTINYETNTDTSVLRQLNLNLGDDGVQDNVIVNGSDIAETFDVSASVVQRRVTEATGVPGETRTTETDVDVLRVAQVGGVNLDIYDVGPDFGGDTVTLNTLAGADNINVNSTVAGTSTTINGGNDLDRINVGSPVSGNLESVVGALVVNGDGGADILKLDDTGDSAGDADGRLTATTIVGAGIGAGITYSSIGTLNVNLGSGADEFEIASTHTGITQVLAGGGNDTVDVESITGATTIHGQEGDDNLRVNSVVGSEANGLATTLVLDGEAGSDNYDVNIFGNGDSLVTVFDSGTATTETDTLAIYGSDVRDDFLLRASDKSSALGGVAFAAALHGDQVERVNYDERLENLIVDTAGGDDHVTLDDNWAKTTVRGGVGKDQFQVGQIFQSARDAAGSNIAGEDEFATVETTRGFLSNGVSNDTTIQGGSGEDIFVIFRNTGELNLDGGDGDDLFTVRSFAKEGSVESTIDLGEGVDTVEYVGNADLAVNGGSGNDTLRLAGTEFSDNYLITSDSIRGTGRTITYSTIEFLEIDGAEGDDEFFVFSTPSTLTTRLLGGLGNDQFHLGGDSKEVIAANNAVVDSMEGPHDLAGIQGPLEIDGFSGAGSSGGFTSPVMLPGETNLAESDGQVIAHSGTGQGGTVDILTALIADLQAVVDADDALTAVADLVGRTLTITNGPGVHRFWQIAAIASGSETEVELTLKNLSVPAAEWGLPDETSSYAISNLSSNFFADESQTLDVVMVFDDGSTTNDVGALSANTLTGLGASGGVTYSNIEIMQVLLGAGNDSLEISGIAEGTVAAVHGGGGNDSITVTGRGDLPLAVYGDTSEDGGLYTSTVGTIQPGYANGFVNHGGDTIDASGSSQDVVVYGGLGDDTITGSQAGDHLAGGAGNDHIHGEAGEDNIYGDSSFNVNSQLLAEDQITAFDPATADGLAKINATFEIVTTAAPGGDTIDGGEDQDTIFGDYGVITRVEGTRRIWATNAGSVLQLETTNVIAGGNDSIAGGGGDDFLFGGLADDTVDGGDGRDTILGDHGIVDLVVNDNDNSTVDVIQSNNPLLGGNDSLSGGDHQDVLFGGTANDFVGAGSGNDVVLGDHGLVDYSLNSNQNFVSIFTTDGTGAGNDTLHGQGGDDFLLGQQGNDYLFGGDGEDDLTGGHNVLSGADGHDVIDGGADADVVLGDNGVITRTLINGEDATWHKYPAPFADVVRHIQRFDNVDLIAGNDTVLGGAGRDILEPQRGDDNVDGGADDDQIVGSEGNDTLAGGAGADFVLGDNGQIIRAYNSDGTPQINAHGVWQRDIVLEEFASITGKIDIDTTPGGSTLLASEILNADVVILSGAFDDNGDRVRNSDNNAWDTSILLVDLAAAGDDIIDGGEGEDVILGQRGDDDINGGGGADLIIGDNATSLVQFDSTMPHIIHGLRVLDVAADVPIDIEFGGSVVVPEIAVTPQNLSLTKPISDVFTDVSPELQVIATDDSLSTTDGRFLVPYVSLVPDIARHADVLAGSDTIDGGAGDDSIYGDNLHAFALPHTRHTRLDVADTNVRKRLEDVDESLRRLVHDFDLVEAGLLGQDAGSVSFANDSISGGAGDDTIVGDDGTIVTPASVRSAIDADDYEADTVARLDHLLSLKHLLLDFDSALEEADVELVSLLVDDAIANNPDRQKIATDDVVVLQHHYVMQNDVVEGGDGNDTIIGDHSLVVLPTASSVEAHNEQFNPQSVPQQVKTRTSQALRDIENARRVELRDHSRNDLETSSMPHRRDRKLIPYKSEYDVSMSNDVLNGDAGVDVIVGDGGETVVPVMLELPNGNADASELALAVNILTNSLDLRKHLDTSEREGFKEYRYFPARIHKSQRDDSVGLDTIDGGADDDVLFGDNAELKPIFVKKTPLDQLAYAATAIETRKGAADVISGGSGNDIVFAQFGNDMIHGNDGDDTLFGGLGQDTLFGDAGTDELRGGSHRDVINSDTVDAKAQQGGGNGNTDEANVTVQRPWGELVSSLYLDGENIDPNTDLWATFTRGIK